MEKFKIDRTRFTKLDQITGEMQSLSETEKAKVINAVIVEAIENRAFNIDKYDIPKTVLVKIAGQTEEVEGKELLRSAVATALNEEIRDKYGDDSFNKRLEFNPYMLIKEGFDYVKKHSINNLGAFKKVDYVDPKTHRKVKLGDGTFKKVMAGADYIRGKRFYDDLIKGNGLSREFNEITGTGSYGEKFAVVYQNFEQTTLQVSKTITKTNANGQKEDVVITGKVTKYIGRRGTIYIVEWKSNEGIEMFTESEFKTKFPKYVSKDESKKYKLNTSTGYKEYQDEEE